MTDFTHLWDVKVSGSIESSAQGKLLGSFDTMPAADSKNNGQIVLYTGATAEDYTTGKYYQSNGTTWVEASFNATDIVVDSALSDSSTNPVQNKVVKGALDQKADSSAIPVKVSDLTNDTGFVTSTVNNLSNYYTKSQIFTKDEVNALIGNINSFEVSVVASLPATGSAHTIYLVPQTGGTGQNIKDEYLWVDSKWEKIGSTEFNLSITQNASGISINGTALQSADTSKAGLMTAAQVTALNGKQDKLVAAGSATKPVFINSSGVPAAINYNLGAACEKGVATEVASGNTNLLTSAAAFTAINDGVPASGTYSEDDSSITFKSASNKELFKVTGIEGGGVQFTLQVNYTGATDCSGISVTATPTSGATATVQGTTNSEGKVFLSVKQNATYKITSSKAGYVFTSAPSVTCSELTTTSDIMCYIPGKMTITVSDEKGHAAGLTITATASGQTTKTMTVPSGQTSVTFTDLAAATWSFSSSLPSGATGANTVTQAIANNGTYSGTITIVYNMVFGVRIAVNTSDPKARVTYPQTVFGQNNNAYGFTKGTSADNIGSWAGCSLITGIKRQTINSSIKNPSESDFKDVADKRSAVAGSASQDVVTYFPSWYVKMTNDGTNVDYAFSMERIDDTWHDYAGSVGTNRVGHFRLGCFCSPESSAAKSYGGTASKDISLTNAITYTQTNRGTGFDLMTWYQWTYVGMLETAIFGTTNLQSVLGNGVSSGSGSSQPALTFTNDYGMYGTTANKTTQMAFFWLQNIYGDYYQWVGGAHSDSNCRLETNTGYSSTSSWDKKALTPAMSSSPNGYLSKIARPAGPRPSEEQDLITDIGFFPAECSGSATTYFADFGRVYPSYFPGVGGYYNNDGSCGPFCANFGNVASGAYAVRLSYRL